MEEAQKERALEPGSFMNVTPYRKSMPSRTRRAFWLTALILVVSLAGVLWLSQVGETRNRVTRLENLSERPSLGKSKEAGVSREQARRSRSVKGGEREITYVPHFGESDETRRVAQVVDQTGRTPLAGIRVRCWDRRPWRDHESSQKLLQGRPVAAMESDGEGFVYLPSMWRGTYFLEAYGPFHHNVRDVQVRLTPDSPEPPARVTVQAGGRVRGVVRDAHRNLATDGVVIALPSLLMVAERRFEVVRVAPIEPDGNFDLTGIPCGRGWRVLACQGNFTPAASDGFEVLEFGEHHVEIQTGPERVLEGLVVDTKNEPVAGARVRYFEQDRRDLIGASILERFGHPRTEVVTNTHGHFRFLGVPIAVIILDARHPEHANSERLELDLRSANLPPALIRLQAAQQLHGRIVDETGRGVPNAQVWYLGSKEWNEDVVTHVVTDGSGHFHMGCLPRQDNEEDPSASFLTIAEGYAPTLAAITLPATEQVRIQLLRGQALRGLVVDKETQKPIQEFQVSTGDFISHMTHMDLHKTYPFRSNTGTFQLPERHAYPGIVEISAVGYEPQRQDVKFDETLPNPYRFELTPGRTLHGRVVTRTGAGVRGAHVELLSTSDHRSFTTQQPANSAVTDENGEFELHHIVETDISLQVRHPDFVVWHDAFISTTPEENRHPIVHEIVLERGGAIAGQITNTDGQAIAGRAVLIRTASADPYRPSMNWGRTDASGHYRVDQLDTSGLHSVTLVPDDAEMSLAGLLEHPTVPDVIVREGQVTTIDLVGDPIAGCMLYGTVTDAAGKCLAGSEVLVIPDVPRIETGALPHGLRIRRTNERGEYRVESLRPGTYLVRFGRFSERHREQAPTTGHRRVQVTREHERRLDLILSAAEVRGLVVDARNGQGLSGAGVALVELGEGGIPRTLPSEASEVHTKTKPDGTFALAGVSPGRYRLEVLASWSDGNLADFYSDAFDVTSLSELVELRVESEPAGHLKIVLQGLERPTLCTAFFDRPTCPDLGEGHLLMVDEPFSELPALAAGELSVVVRSAGYREARVPVTVIPGKTVTVPVPLVRGAQLLVKVRNAKNRIARGASIEIEHKNGTTILRRKGDPFVTTWSGEFTTTILEPGVYWVRASQGDVRSARQKVTIPETGEVRLALQLGI